MSQVVYLSHSVSARKANYNESQKAMSSGTTVWRIYQDWPSDILLGAGISAAHCEC